MPKDLPGTILTAAVGAVVLVVVLGFWRLFFWGPPTPEPVVERVQAPQVCGVTNPAPNFVPYHVPAHFEDWGPGVIIPGSGRTDCFFQVQFSIQLPGIVDVQCQKGIYQPWNDVDPTKQNNSCGTFRLRGAHGAVNVGYKFTDAYPKPNQ